MAAAADTSEASAAGIALAEANINWERLDKTRFHVIGAILFTAQQGALHPTAVVKTRMQVAEGLMSSICSCSYFVPLDVICQRLMVQGLPGMATYRGPFDVINKVVRTEGIRGLYRGFGITMLTQSPASALWWSAYGGAQHAIWSLGYGNDSQTKPSQSELVVVQATAGTIAGACSSIITTPVDTIKTRLQVMDNYGKGRPSVMKTTRLLLDEDGWRGFYRGFGPRFLNMSVWGTSMIVTYELIKRLSVKSE
uniref:Solute carrier family 25 member 44 n=1 Tax=Zea mays TaxID=4577 RepID=A0A804N355_MAIZE